MSMPDLIGAQWRKSSRSDENGGACVEIADLNAVIAARDSKDPNGPNLTFTATAWRTFTQRIKTGDHDLT